MPTYVALLRAVNVGGTGKLSMADFRKVLEGLGFRNVETYIQSGNAVFDASGSAIKVGAAIAAGLEKLMGTPAGVMIRTHDELSRIIAENPFSAEAAADGARVHAAFLAGPAPQSHRYAISGAPRPLSSRRRHPLSPSPRWRSRDQILRKDHGPGSRHSGHSAQLEHRPQAAHHVGAREILSPNAARRCEGPSAKPKGLQFVQLTQPTPSQSA